MKGITSDVHKWLLMSEEVCVRSDACCQETGRFRGWFGWPWLQLVDLCQCHSVISGVRTWQVMFSELCRETLRRAIASGYPIPACYNLEDSKSLELITL